MAAEDLTGFIRTILANPIDESFFEKSFNAKLKKTVDNPAELRYEGPGPVLSDGVRIDKLLLVKYSDGKPAPLIVSANFSGRCVNIHEIEKSFKNVKYKSFPEHPSPNPVITYDSPTDTGSISFFVNVYSRCLSSLKIIVRAPLR
jgi:hypothetical protein